MIEAWELATGQGAALHFLPAKDGANVNLFWYMARTRNAND
jgi:hypothetical protein